MTLPPRQTRAFAADDAAVRHERAGDDRALADTEDLADLGAALDDLDDLRLEQALERRADVVGQLVDDVVQADVDAFGLGGAAGGLGDLGVEADDDRVRGRRQHDVVVGDVAGALVEDVEPDLLLVELLERVGDRAERAGHVGLEDDPQLLGLAGLDLRVEVLERGPTAPLPALGGVGGLAALDHRPGFLVVADDAQDVAGRRDLGRPRTTTALDGPALVTRLPLSFSSARTRPNVSPTTMMSPTLSVPVWTSAVATGPRPLSSWASTIVPIAGRFGLALSSWRSATSRIISISSSRPRRVLAETGTSGTSPPYSSTTMPASVSSVLTRSGLASGLSILLSAMTIGTLAALAWLIASSVWGMTPSSAATTTTAMSVTRAPRARIAVNAS